MLNKKTIRKVATKNLIGGLALLVLVGCDNYTTGGEYNRVVQMPEECKNLKLISAGYTTSVSDNVEGNYDWMSFRDERGNVYIYRINSKKNIWYRTIIKR